MTGMEYPDLDAAVEQSTAELIAAAASDCGMLAILKGDDGKWYCRFDDEANTVIIADSYEAMIEVLEDRGILSAVGRRCGGDTTRPRCKR